MNILVLGGYGGTGRLFCRYLLQETEARVIVAGRRLDKARDLAERLTKGFPADRVSARHADASDRASLDQAFIGIDLVLVAATTTKWAGRIAEAALAAGIDYLDIYFQQDVYPVLLAKAAEIKQSGRCFITQAGFHPGLPAVFIRQAARYFDRYDRAIVALAMNEKIEFAESVHELVDAFINYRPEFFTNGAWRLGTYKDAIKIDFGPKFGVKNCMPLDMVELRPLPDQFGLRETGVFAAGFNWFVDYVYFPFLLLSQKIKKGCLKDFWARMLILGINTFSSSHEGVVFLLLAEGEKNGRRHQVRIVAEHDSAYDFTVIPVIALLKQYMDSSVRRPGLHMMGLLADPDRLLVDMEKMGVKIRTESDFPTKG